MSTSPRRSNRPPQHHDGAAPTVWSSIDSPQVSIAWLTAPRVGEFVSGDAVLVRHIEATSKAVLVGVIDALGHGPKAAVVADSSVDYLAHNSHSGVSGYIAGLHENLQGTRGAAALLLLVSATTLEFCSVGNIELRSNVAKLPFVLTPGVVGVRLRQPKVAAVPAIAERFVAYSDGISGRFDLRTLQGRSPSELASHIFATHRRSHDDATVVVIDVLR